MSLSTSKQVDIKRQESELQDNILGEEIENILPIYGYFKQTKLAIARSHTMQICNDLLCLNRSLRNVLSLTIKIQGY
jgi:hypothetical protein